MPPSTRAVEIPEPHAFTAEVKIYGQDYAFVFEEHEHAGGAAARTTTCAPPSFMLWPMRPYRFW
jgi:hypothetical protein